MGIVKAISKDEKIRVCYVDVLEAVTAICDIHAMPFANRQLFAEVALNTVLLSADIKSDSETTCLVLNAPKPFFGTVVVCNAEGNIKGYSTAECLLEYDYAKDLSGKAQLNVIRDPGMKVAYNAAAKVCGNSFADCLTEYMRESQQQPSLVFERCQQGEICRGLLIQPVLNGEFGEVEQEKDALKAMAEKLFSDLEETERVFSEFGFYITEQKPIKAECDCSREKTDQVVISLGKQEAQAILDEMGTVEVNCPYCEKKYQYNREQVNQLFS